MGKQWAIEGGGITLRRMNFELINTGTELMLGRVLNTHQQWLCRRLADMGYAVKRQVAVPDKGEDICQAVQEALARAQVVITTGGLGPTSDDLTRDYIARLLGRRLVQDAKVLAHIEGYFSSRNRAMPASTAVQAMVPEGAEVLWNPNGTAPGLAMKVAPNPFSPEGRQAWLMMLPGPPRELRPMFDSSVRELLGREAPPPGGFVCRTLRTTGIGESMVEEIVDAPLRPLMDAGLELGYCARTGQVDVRLAARGENCSRLVKEAEQVVRSLLNAFLYGEDDADLEMMVVKALTERGETLALAESCTGGLLAHRITNVPGASGVLLTGFVCYSNLSKQELLGVPASVLAEHGAVSEPVARQLAEGARHRLNATYGVGITGIAGPTGGTSQKPVGTVYIAVAGPRGTEVVRNFNPFDRETFKNATTQQALDLLRKTMRERA